MSLSSFPGRLFDFLPGGCLWLRSVSSHVSSQSPFTCARFWPRPLSASTRLLPRLRLILSVACLPCSAQSCISSRSPRLSALRVFCLLASPRCFTLQSLPPFALRFSFCEIALVCLSWSSYPLRGRAPLLYDCGRCLSADWSIVNTCRHSSAIFPLPRALVAPSANFYSPPVPVMGLFLLSAVQTLPSITTRSLHASVFPDNGTASWACLCNSLQSWLASVVLLTCSSPSRRLLLYLYALLPYSCACLSLCS